MIEEAQRLHHSLRMGNIHWFNGSLEKYKKEHNEQFDLAPIAKAFHWMNRPKVLEELFDMVTVSGGVAIIDNYEPNKKLTTWQEHLNEIIRRWYGEERRAGRTTYNHPTESHEDVILNSNFKLEVHHLPIYEIN